MADTMRVDAAVSQVFSVAGAYMAFSAKNNLDRFAGIVTATVAGADGASAALDARHASLLSRSSYGLAIAYAYISLAVLRSIRPIFPGLPEELQLSIKDQSRGIKSAWIKLISGEVSALVSFIESVEVDLRDADAAQSISETSGHFQPIIDLQFMIREFDLRQAELHTRLEAFSDQLRSCMSSEEAKSEHAALKERKVVYGVVGVLCIAAFFVIPQFADRTSGSESGVFLWAAEAVEIIGIMLLIAKSRARSSPQKNMIENCKNFREYLQGLKLRGTDFVIGDDDVR